MSIEGTLYAASHFSAYFAALAAGIVGYGFVRLAFRQSGLVGHMAVGLLMMHLAVFLRTLYWDAFRNLAPEELWTWWYDWSGESSINVFFNVLVILAGYHSLKALHLAIPADVRAEYSLIGAAFYPRRRVLQRFCDALARLLRRKRR